MTFNVKPLYILILLICSCNSTKLKVIAEIDKNLDEVSAVTIINNLKV